MEIHKVKIYQINGMIEVDIEAKSPREARGIAKIMLEEGDGRYSDFDEADFKDPDREYIFVTDDDSKVTKGLDRDKTKPRVI